MKPSDSLIIQGYDNKTWLARFIEARQYEDQVWAIITWWYADDDLPAHLRMPEIREPCEFIESNHYDIVSSESIQGKAKVDKVDEENDDRKVDVPPYGFLTRQTYDCRRKQLTVSRIVKKTRPLLILDRSFDSTAPVKSLLS